MLHKAHYIKIDPTKQSQHRSDGLSSGRVYEVIAVDHEHSVYYLYNDNHTMLPINEYHCLEVMSPENHRDNLSEEESAKPWRVYES